MNELKQKEAELDHLLSMKATDIWNNDLEVFLAEWEVSMTDNAAIPSLTLRFLELGDARI